MSVFGSVYEKCPETPGGKRGIYLYNIRGGDITQVIANIREMCNDDAEQIF